MDITRKIIAVLLCAVVFLGWFMQVTKITKSEVGYKNDVIEADNYVKEGLYQKAIINYEDALDKKDSKKNREKLMDSYRAAYADEVIDYSDIVAAYTNACESEPTNTKYWKELLQLYIDHNDYRTAYSAYKKALRRGVKDSELEPLGNKIIYSYKIDGQSYVSASQNHDGYISVSDGENWGVMAPNGDWVFETDYEYISPVSAQGEILCKNSKGSRIINTDKIVQCIINDELRYKEVYAIENGVFPYKKESGEWAYYDSENKKTVSDGYDKASSFVNGIAVVNTKNKWKIIDSHFKSISKDVFDNIMLLEDGSYVYDNTMIAEKDNKYGIYDERGKFIAAIPGKKADCYHGGYIAYQNDEGKWGYVDSKGKIVIKPKYKKAKSFSNGLAAVCKGSKWGFIDEKGSLVIDYQFSNASYFSEEGFCVVSTENNLKYILKLNFMS